MLLSARQFRLAVWIACFAILMAALAPSISHVLAAHHGEPSAPHCHPEAGNSQNSHGPAHHAAALLVDCEYCTLQADLPALPPLPKTDLFLVELIQFMPPLFFVAPHPLFIWLHARSRAPPAL
jgi:hypothetical protein